MSHPSACCFSYGHFRDLVRQARALDFAFARFGERNPLKRRVLLLRHDVDLDMFKAVAMARIEAELGVRSTYFLRVSAPFYNLFEPTARDAAREILALGHEVGLHFDTQAYREPAGNGWESLIESEARVLGECVAREIRCVSFHRPTPDLLNMELEGLISAYSPRYFSALKYLSDSGMRWREGCACTHLPRNPFPGYQVLIHPFWWNDVPCGGVSELLQSLELERRQALRTHLLANISTYRPADDR